jgi:hypothetical protein
MGYCAMPYRVDFKRLRGLRRSRDAALLERVVALAAELGVESDEDDEDDDGDVVAGDDPEYDALRRFLHGQPPDPATLDAHGSMMSWVCALCTGPVKNGFLELKWITAAAKKAEGADWRTASRDLIDRLKADQVDAHFREVESALQRHGAADRVPVRQLFEGGYPASPPTPPEPLRSAGYLTVDAARAARDALKVSQWKDLTTEVRHTLSMIERAVTTAIECGHGVQGEVSYLTVALMVNTLDVARVEALRGSRSEAFLERLLFFSAVANQNAYTAKVGALSDEEFLAWKRKHYPDQPEPEEAPPNLTAVPRAAWEILHRKRLDPDRAPIYVAALQLACAAIGEPLDNAEVAPAAPIHFEAVDAALATAGLARKISMSKLVFGGPPIAIPATDDFPAIGYLTPATVKAARGLIAKHDWSAQPAEVQGTLRLVNTWIEEAASRGEGLVCFYQ